MIISTLMSIGTMPSIHIRSHKDILWLFLDNHRENTLNAEMLGQLAQALQKAPGRSPRLIVLAGAGEQAFCSGVDSSVYTEEQRQAVQSAAENVYSAMQNVQAKGIPIVAVVTGSACGIGCELVALCDVVIARDDSRFRFPTPEEKLFPSTITLQLPPAGGKEMVSNLLQNGETIDAHQALHFGLAHQVLPSEHFTTDMQELLVMLSVCHQVR